MDSPLQLATTPADHPRARFEAARRRIFDELGNGSARWRLTWLLPVHVAIVAVLVAGGESSGRAIVQGSALTVLTIAMVARSVWNRRPLRLVSLVVGLASYFAFLATTGGLASPLLMIGAVMMTSVATGMIEPRWLRGSVFLALLAGFVALAVLSLGSQSAAGQLAPPLGGAAPSAQYVTLALLASVFAMVGIHRMGCALSRGYERAALELVERREELCSENEDRSRALEGMAARLAHEVKNPLAAIKGLSTHVARSTSDPKTAERLAIVAAEADRLQAIVDGFLSFSRGLDDLNLAATRPHELARELTVLLETRAEEAGVSLVVSGAHDVVVDADARKLRQALLNLVLNAIQASPRGSSVQLGVERDCEGVRVTVHDDGVGMTPEVLERIRKPYFTTKEGGTGLGVAVARAIVEQHGGRLDVASAAGKGTTVTIVLPSKAKACAKLPNPARGGCCGDPSPAAAR